MGALLFELVTYTGTLSYQHYDLTPIQTIFTTTVEPTGPMDVADILQEVVAEGFNHFQIRLRFAVDTDGDLQEDIYRFLDEPVLEVVYTIP